MRISKYYMEVNSYRLCIEAAYCKHYGNIYKNKFFANFQSFNDYGTTIGAIVIRLWLKHINGSDITNEDLKEECIHCAGLQQFDAAYAKNPIGFDEALLIILDFIDEADKEYYSGLTGCFRRFRSYLLTQKDKKGYKKIE